MKVRDLERLLIESGVGAAKIDAITRRLREVGRLPKGGRGTNAPDVGAAEAAAILLAVAGSSKGVEADTRLVKLQPLPAVGQLSGGLELLQAITDLLQDPEHLARVSVIRVSRTTRQATFIYYDDAPVEFRDPDRELRPDRFFVEGSIPAGLLRRIADALREVPARAEPRKSAGRLLKRSTASEP